MKKWICIIAVALLASQASAQTLHALLFVNERESGREVDRTADMANMSKFFETVAAQLGYRYNLSKNSDALFTAARVNSAIEALNVASGDIVVFYYSGHGYNEGKNVWPTVSLKDKNYWLSDILARLHERAGSAKLIMCIADCCNNRHDAPLPARRMNPVSTDNVKALFTGFEGRNTLIMSASNQGQFSYSCREKGALFGIALRMAIEFNTDNSARLPDKWEDAWTQVMAKASELTAWMLSQGNPPLSDQKPQYNIIRRASVYDE